MIAEVTLRGEPNIRHAHGELDYANEVEDVLRKVPEQRRQISALEDR
jgi:hypothetical protein